MSMPQIVIGVRTDCPAGFILMDAPWLLDDMAAVPIWRRVWARVVTTTRSFY